MRRGSEQTLDSTKTTCPYTYAVFAHSLTLSPAASAELSASSTLLRNSPDEAPSGTPRARQPRQPPPEPDHQYYPREASSQKMAQAPCATPRAAGLRCLFAQQTHGRAPTWMQAHTACFRGRPSLARCRNRRQSAACRRRPWPHWRSSHRQRCPRASASCTRPSPAAAPAPFAPS